LRDFFVHPDALCEATDIGRGTRVEAFAHVLPGARIGADCTICGHVLIEDDVTIGDRVTIKPGVQLWNGTRIGDDVFVGPNATFANEVLPRSGSGRSELPVTLVANHASIGANATVLPGLTIGRNAVIGAGAVVTNSVPANAIVQGNPALIRGYVDAVQSHAPRSPMVTGESLELVGGAHLVHLTCAVDMRGSLAASELTRDIPFVPRRFFVVYRVPTAEARGAHAHRACHQFLMCLSGSIVVLVDDGIDRAQVVLDDPGVGLYMPPMIWGTQYAHSPDAILAVLASDPYDANDYVRDYDEFLSLRGIALTPERD
jgi:UDP-2-acetamido-3-amino-2,3-dideoxy-glucuronate N-acetyltransferase